MTGPSQRREFAVERMLREQREKMGIVTPANEIASDLIAGDSALAKIDNSEVLEAINGLRSDVQALKGALRDVEVISSDDSEMAKDVRIEIAQMVRVIAKTKQEIAQIKHPEDDSDRFEKTHSELDEIVMATERATQGILNATEQIETVLSEAASHAQEDPELVEILDKANDQLTLILEACNFQDITGQRITKVLKTVRFVEDRILAMISIWGVQAFEDLPVASDAEGDSDNPDANLLQGPQTGNEGITQDEIDALFD